MKRSPELDNANALEEILMKNQSQALIVSESPWTLPIGSDVWNSGVLKSLVDSSFWVPKNNYETSKEFGSRIRNVFENLNRLSCVCHSLYASTTKAVPWIIIYLTHDCGVQDSPFIAYHSKCTAAKRFDQSVRQLQLFCQERNSEGIEMVLTEYTIQSLPTKSQKLHSKSGNTLSFRKNLLQKILGIETASGRICKRLSFNTEEITSIGKALENIVDGSPAQNLRERAMVDSLKLILNFCHQPVPNSFLLHCVHNHYSQCFELLFIHNAAYKDANNKTVINYMREEAQSARNTDVLSFLNAQ